MTHGGDMIYIIEFLKTNEALEIREVQVDLGSP